MPENFPVGQCLRKADKCFCVCIVNLSMVTSNCVLMVREKSGPIEWSQMKTGTDLLPTEKEYSDCLTSASSTGSMDQISIKTPNPKN
jgi:hypothetical protein